MLADGLPTDSYLRMLSFADGIDLEWGMRSEKNAKTALSEQYRSDEQIAGLVAGKCGACGTVQFPQLTYCVTCQAPACSSSLSPWLTSRRRFLPIRRIGCPIIRRRRFMSVSCSSTMARAYSWKSSMSARMGSRWERP